MVFKQDKILVTASVDRKGIFFVLREHGPDVIFRLDNNYLEVVKGFLTPEEQEFIKDNINYYE